MCKKQFLIIRIRNSPGLWPRACWISCWRSCGRYMIPFFRICGALGGLGEGNVRVEVASKWCQAGKMCPRRFFFSHHLFDAIWEGVKRPKETQRGPKRRPDPPRTSKIFPKWNQVGTKIASKIDLILRKARIQKTQ